MLVGVALQVDECREAAGALQTQLQQGVFVDASAAAPDAIAELQGMLDSTAELQVTDSQMVPGCGSGAYVRAQRHICLAVNIDRHDSCAPLLRSTSRSQSTGKACETMACWVGSRCCCCLHGPQAGRQLT